MQAHTDIDGPNLKESIADNPINCVSDCGIGGCGSATRAGCSCAAQAYAYDIVAHGSGYVHDRSDETSVDSSVNYVTAGRTRRLRSSC